METGKEEKINLVLNWATYQASFFACKNFHYSKSIPACKLVKIGVWENGIFKGVVLFSRGANKSIGSPYGLKQTEVCELSRIALKKHFTPVSKIVSIAIKMLKKLSPDLKLIVSYADIDQGHEGKIYKAGNWIYQGVVRKGAVSAFIFRGKKTHTRSIGSTYGKGSQNLNFLKKIDPEVKPFISKGRHKYLYILDDSIRNDIMKIIKKD